MVKINNIPKLLLWFVFSITLSSALTVQSVISNEVRANNQSKQIVNKSLLSNQTSPFKIISNINPVNLITKGKIDEQKVIELKDNGCNCFDLKKNKGKKEEEEEVTIGDYVFLVVLLLFAAVVAGLTIGLMSMDATNLEILKKSGTEEERQYATIIEPIRKNSHLLLCTLLLANTVANESLPILLDPIIGGGWNAILGSSALIVIFGEIIPQAICTRYGLYIGAKLAWLVKLLIFLLYPIAFPIAKLLDYMLGKSHGTNYKKAQLKELVQLHDKVLIPEEVRIIKGVLDLREKSARSAMTELKHMFALDFDSILDKDHIEKILAKGHSRIPVFRYNRSNLIGVILVKRLIALKHRTPIHKLPLSPLPTFSPDTPLFETLAYFQQGKSHMAKVSYDDQKAVGIITLEDVLEELIGGEIVDETDEFMSIETKIKVTRHINQINQSASTSPSCFCSPRISPTILPESPLPVASFDLDSKSSSSHLQVPGKQMLKAKSAKDYYKLSEAQEGDLVLVTTVPGTTLIGQVVEPFGYQSKNSSRRNSTAFNSKPTPLILVPKLMFPKLEPTYHLVDHPTRLEPVSKSILDLHQQPRTPTPSLLITETTPLLSTKPSNLQSKTTPLTIKESDVI